MNQKEVLSKELQNRYDFKAMKSVRTVYLVSPLGGNKEYSSSLDKARRNGTWHFQIENSRV